MAALTLAILAVPLVFAAIADGRRSRRAKRSPVTEPPTASIPPQGGLIISNLPPEYTSRPDDPREQMILSAVRAGLSDPPVFVEVMSFGEAGTPQEGITLRIPVMHDALTIEGVRVTTSYPTAQRIADVLSIDPAAPVTMLTPWVAGLIYDQAFVQLTPTTSQELSDKNVTSDTSQMIEASAVVDAKIAKAKEAKGLTGRLVMIANPSKDWVVTLRNTEPGVHPETGVRRTQAAANHGLYEKPWRPIQNVGLAHNMMHVDYSQGLRYMGSHVTVVMPDQSELQFPTAEALQDPVLGPLLTGTKGKLLGKQVGEGALPYARHPFLEPAVVA